MKNQVLSIEQMKELEELGIDISKASCCYCKVQTPNRIGYTWYLLFENLNKRDEEHMPTFTLQDILELLPPIINESYSLEVSTGYHSIFYQHWLGHKSIEFEWEDNMLNAAFKLLKWCKENKYI